jgi:hypothetical protein
MQVPKAVKMSRTSSSFSACSRVSGCLDLETLRLLCSIQWLKLMSLFGLIVTREFDFAAFLRSGVSAVLWAANHEPQAHRQLVKPRHVVQTISICTGSIIRALPSEVHP